MLIFSIALDSFFGRISIPVPHVPVPNQPHRARLQYPASKRVASRDHVKSLLTRVLPNTGFTFDTPENQINLRFNTSAHPNTSAHLFQIPALLRNIYHLVSSSVPVPAFSPCPSFRVHFFATSSREQGRHVFFLSHYSAALLAQRCNKFRLAYITSIISASILLSVHFLLELIYYSSLQHIFKAQPFFLVLYDTCSLFLH
jgi:hypothetical protein